MIFIKPFNIKTSLATRIVFPFKVMSSWLKSLINNIRSSYVVYLIRMITSNRWSIGGIRRKIIQIDFFSC
ncbi:hypothetical protein Hanom_Chr01g00074391 [Helianthus anomalus]